MRGSGLTVLICALMLLASDAFAVSRSDRSSDNEASWLELFDKDKPMVVAVRTNLLVPALNVGAEVPLGDRWSVSADYYYPWIWPAKKNRNCFELLGWSAEGRYWFGKDRTEQDRLLGHSAGVYAAGGYFDIERNYKGRQGEFISAGIDYTYAMALGRKGYVNMEFTLAFGYIHSWNTRYTVSGPYGPLYREPGTEMFDYFGPTKVAVSLVVPLRWSRKEGRK